MSSEFKNITQLAKQLAEKELANPSTLESKEMLDALEDLSLGLFVRRSNDFSTTKIIY